MQSIWKRGVDPSGQLDSTEHRALNLSKQANPISSLDGGWGKAKKAQLLSLVFARHPANYLGGRYLNPLRKKNPRW